MECQYVLFIKMQKAYTFHKDSTTNNVWLNKKVCLILKRL